MYKRQGFGNEVLQTLGLLLYALDTVVDVEHLTAAQQFTSNRRGDLRVLIGAHIGEHGQAVLGRSRQRGHLANARDSHLQRAWNRRGRQAQYIDIRTYGLEPVSYTHLDVYKRQSMTRCNVSAANVSMPLAFRPSLLMLPSDLGQGIERAIARMVCGYVECATALPNRHPAGHRCPRWHQGHSVAAIRRCCHYWWHRVFWHPIP